MNLTIGFCEIALVTSLFFYPQSRWIGITLLCIAILGKIIGFALIWNEKIERAKELNSSREPTIWPISRPHMVIIERTEATFFKKILL